MAASSGNYASLAELAATQSPQDNLTPANSLTQVPRVQFARSGVQPPGGVYVTEIFSLRIIGVTNDTLVDALTIGARLLMPDGTLEMISQNLAPLVTDGNTANVFLLPLPECFLLDVFVFAHGDSPVPGRLYVRVELTAGAAPTKGIFSLLCADYVSANRPVTWPNTIARSPGEGPGYIHTVDASPAGAGQEMSVTVPTGVRWNVLAGNIKLATSAVVPARVPTLLIGDAVTAYSAQICSGQDASATQQYTLIPGVARDALVTEKPRSILLGTFGLGQEINFTVPNGVTWEVIALGVQFVTSAHVNNRTPILRFVLKVPVRPYQISIPVTIPPSFSQIIVWSCGSPIQQTVEGGIVANIPVGATLSSGDIIQTLTLFLDVGDQYQNCWLWVLERSVTSGVHPLPSPLHLSGGQTIKTSTANLDAGDSYAGSGFLVEEWIVTP